MSENALLPTIGPLPLRFQSASRLVVGAVLLFAAVAAIAENPSTDRRQLGNKYSPLAEINRDNVDDLEVAWEYHTGEIDLSKESLVAFEDEPSLVAGNLIVCTISRRLIALDPATGQERWIFDPESAGATKKCRGINAWEDKEAPENAHCRTRIFLGTADYRLFAISARDGRPCGDFGDDGVVQLKSDKAELFPGEVAATSRPAVVNGVVVVASVVIDNQRLDKQVHELEWDLEEIEKEVISATLEKTRWNRTAAARKLGISFRSFRYRLKKLGLDTEDD